MNFMQFLNQQKYFLLETLTALYYASYSLSEIALDLLVQDKICLTKFNQTDTFCQHINKVTKSTIKDHILVDLSVFKVYKYVNTTKFMTIFEKNYYFLVFVLGMQSKHLLNLCGRFMLEHFWMNILTQLIFSIRCLL